MSLGDNVFYAKKNIVPVIYRLAKLEGIAVTFPDTQEIFDNRSVAGVSIDDTMAIVNLKRVWQHMLSESNRMPTFEDLKELNEIIGQGGVVRYPGEIRHSVVTIGGAKWIPPALNENDAKNIFYTTMSEKTSNTEKALDLFCILAKRQLFNNGNKRTANLIANWVLIHNGCGLLSIPPEDMKEYFTKLVNYYDNGNKEKESLKRFLRKHISGIR